MATLAQERAAIRKGIEEARKPTAAAERKAIGEAMIARRRGEQQVDDINAVVRPTKARRTLRTIEPRGSLPAQKGRGNYVPPPVNPGSGGGIASPLVEQDFATRQYWDDRTVTTVDGLFSFVIRPIKEITQQDANEAEVKQQFAEPPL